MFILFSIFAAANFFYVVIAKVNSSGFVNSSRSRYALFLTTTALVGCTFLFVLSGFKITINRDEHSLPKATYRICRQANIYSPCELTANARDMALRAVKFAKGEGCALTRSEIRQGRVKCSRCELEIFATRM